MSDDTVQARGRSMEEAFFAHENRQLQESSRTVGMPMGIADFDLDTAIHDSRLRQDLKQHHVGGNTAAAMTLVPLVAVAWADRELHERERTAVLQAAEAAGIAEGSPSHALLASWLHQRPDPELFERWKSFIIALCADMDARDVEALRVELLGRARAVAESVGGILGFRRISAREQEILDELEHAFPA